MKPVLVYVDDEPQNLVVFEAACPDDWDVHTFDSPAKALEQLDQINPVVIASDQRMPGMTGVQFLEIARKIVPDAVRMIVTGYSDEDLVVESVRKARVFDYLKKPWDVDNLVASLQRAIDYGKAESESKRLQRELIAREKELIEANRVLTATMRDLELAQMKESELRAELECWVPPFLLQRLKNTNLTTEIRCDLVGITFDIINSSRLHDAKVNGRPLRSQIIQVFSEAVLRHGGWRESHSGDSAYGHFGLLGDSKNAAQNALAAAHEFRAGLKSLAGASGLDVECGIALHVAKDCRVQIHTVQLQTPNGPVTQKSFDTTSADVDLLHRMEKLVHALPGSNIVMSRVFMDTLTSKPERSFEIGAHRFAGQDQAVHLEIIPSYYVKEDDLNRVRGLAATPAPRVA